MDYSKAPYNFIPLSNRVFERYTSKDELPAHDEILSNGYTGTIEYTINCESDLILSDGKGKFFKDHSGNYAIPGSSLRGMVRNNVFTLGFCAVGEEIEDSKFLYRRFAAKMPQIEGCNPRNLNSEYKDRLGMNVHTENSKRYSILENVKGGYIKCDRDEHYIITKSKEVKGKTYFRIGEDSLVSKTKGIRGINYLYNNGQQNRNYRPYTLNISFDLDEVKNRMRSIKSDNSLKYKGTLLNSNFINNKKGHYIINEKDTDTIDLSKYKDDVRAYKEYYTKDKKSSEFYSLPNKGEEKAVFYIEYNGKIYFGFTPFLRLFYDESVHGGLSTNHKEKDKLDYNKSIFGFANENNSYKSRVSFEDALLIGKGDTHIEEMILQNPKPTCIAHYLNQDKKNYSTYNQDFTLRGIKFYWTKEAKAKVNNDRNRNIISNEEAIKKSSIFRGRITFTNLNEDELGILVYSLSLKDDCNQQIGKGKPYGFGRIKIKDIKIKNQSMQKRYSSIFSDNSEELNADDLIEKYKKFICEKLKLNDIEEDLAVKTLFNVKSFIAKDDRLVEYLDGPAQFKYFMPLPTAEQVINSSNGFKNTNESNNVNRFNSSNKLKEADKRNIHKSTQSTENNNVNLNKRQSSRNKDNQSFGNSLAEQLKNWGK